MDTMGLTVFNHLRDNAAGDVHVPCSDTDTFILSMNLAAIGHVVAHVTIINRVDYGDRNKSRALICLHNFTDNNWRRQFAGISKKKHGQ